MHMFHRFDIRYEFICGQQNAMQHMHQARHQVPYHHVLTKFNRPSSKFWWCVKLNFRNFRPKTATCNLTAFGDHINTDRTWVCALVQWLWIVKAKMWLKYVEPIIIEYPDNLMFVLQDLPHRTFWQNYYYLWDKYKYPSGGESETDMATEWKKERLFPRVNIINENLWICACVCVWIIKGQPSEAEYCIMQIISHKMLCSNKYWWRIFGILLNLEPLDMQCSKWQAQMHLFFIFIVQNGYFHNVNITHSAGLI